MTRAIVWVWVFFFTRALFYCVQQPLWEGYDEWAHFAYIQHIAEYGKMPSRHEPVSPQVARSLKLTPLSTSAALGIKGAHTHDSFWELSLAERDRREQQLRQLHVDQSGVLQDSSILQYEAQQPPLYYLLLTPVYLLVRHASLPTQVFTLRMVSVAIASLVIFVAYPIARRALDDSRVALLAVILLASLPGLYVNVCRVGNECLSILVVSILILNCLKTLRAELSTKNWVALGFWLGLALLTKAYTLAFFALIPVVAMARLIRKRTSWSSEAVSMFFTFAVAIAVAGWWYWQQWQTTSTISGEQLHVASNSLTVGQKILAALRVDWLRVLDTGAFSHIWVGGWSFLVVRSWMYRVCEAVAFTAGVGLIIFCLRSLRNSDGRRRPNAIGEAVVLVAACGCLCAALAYHSLVIFLAQNVSTGIGWYLYAVVAAESVLLGLGCKQLLGKRRAPMGIAAMCGMSLALDLYTTHFLLLPYYTGIIRHKPTGALQSLKVDVLLAQFGTMLTHLSVDEPVYLIPAVVVGIWMLYVLATISLGGMALVVANSVQFETSISKKLEQIRLHRPN